MIAYVDERAQGDEPLALLLANFLKNGGRVLRRELLAGGMSKWTYDEAKKRLDDVGAKGQDAMMARHSPKTADSEPGDGHDAPPDEVVPRSCGAGHASDCPASELRVGRGPPG